jgi:hypothetical protein
MGPQKYNFSQYPMFFAYCAGACLKCNALCIASCLSCSVSRLRDRLPDFDWSSSPTAVQDCLPDCLLDDLHIGFDGLIMDDVNRTDVGLGDSSLSPEDSFECLGGEDIMALVHFMGKGKNLSAEDQKQLCR